MTFDHSIVAYLNEMAQAVPLVEGVTVFFARYVPYLFAALFVVWALLLPRQKKEKLILFCEGFGAGLLARFGGVELIRAVSHRPRPFAADPSIIPLISETSSAFPSGHATFFFALSTIVYLHNRRWGVWCYLASALIGMARVAAGVHYPLDIVGGAVLGILVGWIFYYGIRAVLKKTTSS
ncbi:MAG: Bacitracin transport permease protein BCRC [Parcubacteria group bacterium Greene0416_79]|nr:MAG: Bacitracin transport permease protein BCRC [Parcubacteria group bacterium Greene0416_79]